MALGLFAVLFFAVVLTNGSGEDKKDKRPAADSKRSSNTAEKAKPQRATPASYTVKLGDNLPSISRKTGLSVEKIQELNPALDPYGLQSGQKIKLRE